MNPTHRASHQSINLLIVLALLLSGLVGSCQPDQPDSKTSPPESPSTSTTELPENTILVTNADDSGPGSLRQAMQDAQDGDTITFDPGVFPPDAPVPIFVTNEELPHIRANNLTLDASDAGVILDGSQIPGDWVAGLQIVSSEGNVIMGFQISRFPGPGIAISGESKHNVIGGDRGVGAGPYGQGNLLSNNVIGIDLASEGTTLNIITGNLIGTDAEGTVGLGNERGGVSITEGAHDNKIEPDNIFATSEKDSIYAQYSERDRLEFPIIFEYDLPSGVAIGATCPNCTVEIFSTSGYEGEILEGQATAGDNGVFNFNKGGSFAGPFLTAKTTDPNGRESSFSFPPTSETGGSLVLQNGNDLPRTQFFLQFSGDLADNHIATQYDGISYSDDFTDFHIYNQGVTRARVSMAGLEPELVDWEKPEFSISQAQDEHFNRISENGIIVTYVLIFWDKETYPGGEGAPCARFKTEEEIERWLEYVRFTVEHLKDRVEYFEIWNEPDIRNYCPKWIELEDYVNLVRRTAPVIREVAPEAKIVVGAISKTFYEQGYLFDLLESDIMPLVDVVSWHPFYGESPKYDRERAYYYGYPDFVQRIKDTAAAHGFVGEYHADEVGWNMEPGGGQEGEHSLIESNKYFLRAVIQHRGMDIDLGTGGSYTNRRMNTLMAGVKSDELPVEIESAADNIMSYTFSTLEGDRLLAVWTHGIAVDNDPGVEATLTIPGFSASDVVGIDILNNFEQELIFEMVDGDLVIDNLMVKDYPLILRLIP